MQDKVTKSFVIGKIIGAHGINGDLRVFPYTEYPERFSEIESIFIDNKEYSIKGVKYFKGKVILNLEGIDNRNDAESLKNSFISIPRETNPETEEDEFYIADILGSQVYNKDGTEKIGILKDVIQTSGVVSNFLIETEEKSIYVPALKEYFEVDLDNRKILSDIPEEYYKL